MSRLRIGYYLAPYPMGGIARHVLGLIDHLRGRHSITVFSDLFTGDPAFSDALAARGVETRVLAMRAPDKNGILRPLLGGLGPVLQARRALLAERLDVIHFHAGRLGTLYAPILASRLAGIETRLLTVHNSLLRNSPPQRLFEGRVLACLDRIVAVCAEVQQELIEKKNAAPERIAVIANGVDVSEFELDRPADAGARRDLGIVGDGPVVGWVGRLEYYKGVDVLIRAAPLLQARWPGLRIVLIGAGPDEDKLKKLAEAEGVAGMVVFAGYRSDARRLMRALDILALPSRYEAQPYALLEAMACGKPAVAAEVGGLASALTDGVTGLFFPSENVAALADALGRLLGDRPMREAMGKAARKRAEADFSQAAMLEKTAALYEK